MPIKTNSPVVQPATSEVVFDNVWMKTLSLVSYVAGGDVDANVQLVLYSDTGEECPAEINMQIANVFAVAEYDETQLELVTETYDDATRSQKIGIIATLLLKFVEEEAKAQKLI